MPIRFLNRPVLAIVMVASTCTVTLAQKAPVPTRVRGAIESIDGDTITVKSRTGEDYKLHMTSDFKVVDIVKASLSDTVALVMVEFGFRS